MTDARKNRETGKGGRADRPCGPPPPPPPLLPPFFVVGLITEGTDCRGGGGEEEEYCVSVGTSVDLEIARETSRFLIPFSKGGREGGLGWRAECSEEDGRM